MERVAKNLSLLSHRYQFVTSMYDFYGFEGKNVSESRKHLIGNILHHLSNANPKAFIFPYIQMYEFEALLFSDHNILCNEILPGVRNANKKEQCILYFNDILAHKMPEQVNDSIHTAPSKRIKKIYHRYKKTSYGHLISEKIGIDKIREKCKGFNSWLKTMQQLTEIVR